MSDAIVSHIEHHEMRERRRIGLIGLVILVGLLVATVLVLVLGASSVPRAVHHVSATPARHYGVVVGAR